MKALLAKFDVFLKIRLYFVSGSNKDICNVLNLCYKRYTVRRTSSRLFLYYTNNKIKRRVISLLLLFIHTGIEREQLKNIGKRHRAMGLS